MAQTHRERFFRLFEDDPGTYMPFFPDITDWYMARRIPPGSPYPFGPGQFIPDKAGIHRLDHDMPDQYRDLTLLDIYKRHDWGFPVHLYDWCEFTYRKPVRRREVLEGDRKTITLETPRGSLTRVDVKAADGSFTPCVHFVKELADLDILRLALEHQQCIPRYERVEAVLAELDGQG
ncbi:MAG: hypothetical protein JXQ83_08760, partial [Candidatus Glassbacteria bacterium]|nr:hypothetical protein [Candidatus Glassbacteria bacterium]